MLRKSQFIFVLLVFVAYIPYCISIFSKVSITSDFSNLVLSSNDIISGNLFLKGWNLTGISFLTTDLLYFIVPSLLFGVSEMSYILAISFMFLAASILSLLLSNNKITDSTLKDMIVFFAVVGFPSALEANIVRAHMGAIVWGFAALYYLYKILHGENKKLHIILAAIYLTMGQTGDTICLILFMVPPIIYCLFSIQFKEAKLIKDELTVIAISALSFLSSFIIDKIYFLIGGANKNDFMDSKAFESLNNIIPKTNIYLEALFGMNNADFFSKNIFSFEALSACLHFIIVSYTIFLLFQNLFSFFFKRKGDFISVVLGIGFILISGLFIFTDIAFDLAGARYIAYIPFMFVIVINRKFNAKKLNDFFIVGKKVNSEKCIYTFLVIVSIMSYQPYAGINVPKNYVNALGSFLEEKGLTNGYTDFWSASVTTVKTKEAVKLRAVTFSPEMAKFSWFCKDEWYHEEASFVVISNASDLFGVTKDNVIAALGSPKEQLEFEGYSIFIYDRNLSESVAGR